MNLENRHGQLAGSAMDERGSTRAFGTDEEWHRSEERGSGRVCTKRIVDTGCMFGREQQVVCGGRRFVERCDPDHREIETQAAKRELDDTRDGANRCREPWRVAICAELGEAICEQPAVRRELEHAQLAELRRAVHELFEQTDRRCHALIARRYFKRGEE